MVDMGNFIECTYAHYKKEDGKTVYFDSKNMFLLNINNVIRFEKYYDYPDVLKVETLTDNAAYSLCLYSKTLSNLLRKGEL